MIRNLLIAIQFLTVFRFKENLEETPRDMAVAIGYFPLVGLLLGGLTAIAFLISTRIFPPLICGILVVLIHALYTQGLHLDGLWPIPPTVCFPTAAAK